MAKLSKHFHFLQADSSRCGAEDIQWNEPNERANYSFFSLDDMFIRPWKCVCLACLSQSTLAQMQHWQECVRMHMCACQRVCVLAFQVILSLYNPLKSLLADDECQTVVPRTSWNLIRGNDGCQPLMYSIFPLNLRAETQAVLSLSPLLPPLRLWSSICSCFPMCLSQRLLADLALTWPRKQKICSFLTESTKFNTQPFSPLCKPCCPRSFKPSDDNW